MQKLILKPKKEESLLRFHPWVFSGALSFMEKAPQEGEIVDICDSKGKFIARGHYQIGSIAVRILTFEEVEIDISFWEQRIRAAYQARKAIGLTNRTEHNTYRLIHGEGDMLPGLIVDIYGSTAVIQAHSVGMHFNRIEIKNAIVKEMSDTIRNVYYKSDATLPFKAGIEPENGYLHQEGSISPAFEYGLQFNIDWITGQKTGFFIDQRENRALLEKYSPGKKVLNMFCYTGGFSCAALRGNAELVHSVDSSAKAIELTDENVDLNFGSNVRHQSFCEDAFRFLDQNKNKYDLIILDPPAFAKHRGALKNALQGYRRLNAKGFEQIAPGGILFTFSCSQVVSKEQFRLAVFSAAAQSKRKVRILHQLSQPADHPINIYHPEGEYLKGLVLYVE